MPDYCRYCRGVLLAKDRMVRSDGKTERLHAEPCRQFYFKERQDASRSRRRGELDAEPRRCLGGKQPATIGCLIANCSRPHYAKGLCQLHWQHGRIQVKRGDRV